MARKILVTAALLIAAAAALAACNGDGAETRAPTATPRSAFPLTIEQSDGQQLTLQQAPQRIVSLSTHATEILCAIGASDQLAAVERYANCPLGSKEKPELDAYKPNLEAIAGYRPDLVYVFSDTDGIVDALRRVGTPVLYLELPSSLQGVLEQIELFGRLSGHEAESEKLVQSMQERMDAVREKVADVGQGPRIFHELDPTYFTAAPTSFVGDFYTLLKAKNIAAGASDQYPQLSAEVIVQRDPEVIVLADGPGHGDVTPEQVKQRPGWDQISALKNDRICVIEPELVSVPGPRVVEGLEALAKCLYPERFP
jgi:iron complex transport system substrate-binding protein